LNNASGKDFKELGAGSAATGRGGKAPMLALEDDGSVAQVGPVQESAYELLRKANIETNRAKMKELGLLAR
jgi:hypothetical protein